jgi:predicted flap endonuclease-1-like 5' DNA nuclease
LAGAGITSLAQLADRSRAELTALHGMGPKALGILEASLAEMGLRLRD